MGGCIRERKRIPRFFIFLEVLAKYNKKRYSDHWRYNHKEITEISIVIHKKRNADAKNKEIVFDMIAENRIEIIYYGEIHGSKSAYEMI